MPQVTDWPARMREMVEFVGLTAEELELVGSTGPLVLKHAEGLTAAIYDHFLQFPQARQFFLSDDGQVDQGRLDRRKHSLARWLRNAMEFQVEGDLPVQLLAMAVVHSHPPAHREHLGSVPSRFMIGTIAFAQTALAKVLRQELADPDQAWRASLAWNKLLMVQLDILLAGYVNEQPTEPHLQTREVVP